MKALKAGLIGRSLSHSISDKVHSEIFPYVCSPFLQKYYDSIDYRMIECADEEQFVETIRNGLVEGFRGYNVTFPFKGVATRIRGSIDAIARDIHSANTIALADGAYHVFSTDGLGLSESLYKALPGMKPSRYRLVILGAGGAARAVLHALYQRGWAQIVACARSAEHARFAFSHYGDVAISTLDTLQASPLPSFIIQATPVGQRSQDALIPAYEWNTGDIAVDLVYNPLRTRFLDHAAAGGATIVSGLGMLIEQAALSQYIWIKKEPRRNSPLTLKQYQELFERLSNFVQARWDDSAI